MLKIKTRRMPESLDKLTYIIIIVNPCLVAFRPLLYKSLIDFELPWDGPMEYKNKLADTPEGVYMTKVLSKTALWSICKHNSKKWGLSPFSKKWGLSPFSRAFIVLLASKEPKNLTNGAKVDCGEALSTFNRKEYHHIFPQAFLEKQGAWSNSDINSLCNFCILPASSNKLISDKAPSPNAC